MEIFEQCKKANVYEFKWGDLHIKFGSETQVLNIPVQGSPKNDPSQAFRDPLQNPMTPDELLFWSSGGAEYKNTDDREVPVPLVGEEIPR